MGCYERPCVVTGNGWLLSDRRRLSDDVQIVLLERGKLFTLMLRLAYETVCRNT